MDRYACYSDVLDYCRRSANPVGRLLLALYGADTPNESLRERRHLHRTAVDQFLAGHRDRLAEGSRLRTARGPRSLRRDDRPDRRAARRRSLASAARVRGGAHACAAAFRASSGPRAAVAGGSRAFRRGRGRHADSRSHCCGGRRRVRAPPGSSHLGLVGGRIPCARSIPNCGGKRNVNDPRRILPTEGRAKRLELLLQLPVPAPAKAPRHHGAVRVLPRGRRRRGRGARSGCRARQACVVAAGDRTRLRRDAAAPGGAGAGSRGSRVRAAAGPVRDDHRRHGDGSGAIALPRFPGARALLPSRGRRRRPHVGGNLRIRRSANEGLRARPGRCISAYEHLPRRRRGRAPRPHLPAAGRPRAFRGHAVVAAARANIRRPFAS